MSEFQTNIKYSLYWNQDFNINIKKIDKRFYLIISDTYCWTVWISSQQYDYIKKEYLCLEEYRRSNIILTRYGPYYDIKEFNNRINIIKEKYNPNPLNTVEQLLRALEIGNYNAAPTTLVQGSPLVVEPLRVSWTQINYGSGNNH